MKVSAKQILIIVIVLLCLIAIAAYYFYKKGKKTVTISPLPLDEPYIKDESGAVINNPSGASVSTLAKLADDLYNDMAGLTVIRDNDLYADWLNLSDTDFVKLANIFNQKHQQKTEATLYEWLYGEVGIWGSDFNAFKKEILSRMARLNLR